MSRSISRILLIVLIFCVSIVTVPAALSGELVTGKILYPQEHSLVGKRVNLVLDPAADWSGTPFFQAVVNHETAYPIVDTSTGRHASQGLELSPGVNVVTVRFLVSAKDEKNKEVLKTVSTRDITVFDREGSFTAPPATFTQHLFHSREQEADCSGCHRMEAEAVDRNPENPADELCYTCHRSIPTGKYIHGPAAVWDCLGCHDADSYPVKYEFSTRDPWKVTKTTQRVEPLVYTLSSNELFEPLSSTLISRDKALQMLEDAFAYLKLNPGDRVRIEAHVDATPTQPVAVNGGKTRSRGGGHNLALTAAQADVIADLFRQAKVVSPRHIVPVGMGDRLPKASDSSAAGKELNNRVEIVLYPSDVKVKNSRMLPILRDRERVLINLAYAQGPRVTSLKVIEKIPPGLQYLKGSGYFKGEAREPQVRGDELVWDLGGMDANFSEPLFYILRKAKNAPPIPAATDIVYRAGSGEVTRTFNPRTTVKRELTIKETCLKCHGGILAGAFRHGPSDEGYCTLCHDPHGSPHPAWLRKSTWDLCTICHAGQASGVHVLAGFVKRKTHPTRARRNPMKPGKRLDCASCHNPHSAAAPFLFQYGAKSPYDLCDNCHPRK